MESDPWLWNVSQVTDFFRHDAANAISDMPNVRLPDIDMLVQVLEENEVSGSVLLTAVDTAFLKDDCNIRSLGMRSAVIRCITKLKAHSSTLNKPDDPPIPRTPLSIAAQPLPRTGTEEQQQPTAPASFDSPGNIRSGEVEVQDERGRKRRKLNLGVSQSCVETPAPPAPPLLPAAFLGDAAQPVEALFYGKTTFGSEITDFRPEGHIAVDIADREDPEMAETNFHFHDQGKLPGEVAYVYSQMRHFFNVDTAQQLTRRGRPAVAMLPCRESLISQSTSQSATVFQMKDTASGDAIAVRENATYLDSQIDYSDLQQDSNLGSEWDFLASKYRQTTDDDILPEYGQSESASISAELQNEMDEEDEEIEDESGEKTLHERLPEIVDSTFESFAEKWKERHLSNLEKKRAWTVWKKHKQSRAIRTALLEGAKAQIANLQARRDKFKKALHSEEWKNESQIVEQCEGMQATIEDIEEWRWKMDVWQRKQEPEHDAHRGQRSGDTSRKTAPAGTAPLRISPHDRFSVEPADSRNEVGEDEESFHSAQSNPEQQEEDRDASDEMSIDGSSAPDDFVVADEASPGPTLDSSQAIQEDPVQSDSQMPSSSPAESTPIKHQESAPMMPSDPEAGTDTESDLPSPSIFLRRHAKPENKTPVKQSFSNNQSEPIEISSDSTPSASAKKKGKKLLNRTTYSDNPGNDTAIDVLSWDMDDLVKRQDRKRILIKLLYGLGRPKREQLQEQIEKLRRPGLVTGILEQLRILQYSLDEVEDNHLELACRLFLAYHFAAPPLIDGPPRDIPWPSLVTDKTAVYTFAGLLDLFLKNDTLFRPPNSTPKSTPKSNTIRSLTQVIDLESEDEEDEALRSTPRRKKKKVVLNSAAEKSQAAAFNRQERFKRIESQASNSQELQAIVQGDPSRSTIPINVATKTDEQELIFIDKKIASDMMEHQINGVRFMWRELVADGEDGQGCVLAHTMGLGKTVQTIAVLVAVNEAAQSNNRYVFEQVPESLRPEDIDERQLRMLILCPAALVQNWRAEIKKWASHVISNVFSLAVNMSDQQLLDQARGWFKVGGVLLMGYELFRSKINWQKSKNEKVRGIGPKLEEYLLRGPEIVVADEAHTLKNDNSAISKCARLIETERRIGLTGTPMSNDVDEIYSLISFAAPNYLGDKSWFNQQFSRPIADGSRAESSYYDVRKMLKKLAVLRHQIEPKVNRADITVLRGFLKPKIEFVVFMPLTPVQLSTYSKYVAALLGDKDNVDASVKTTRIFVWLWILTLLTNHPLAFKMKLQASQKAKKRKGSAAASKDQADSESESGPATPEVVFADADAKIDDEIHALALSEAVMDDVIRDIKDDPSPELSAKMSMMINIIKLSKQCKDKVLVFSSSIATLDYVQQLLGARQIPAGRIDGSVNVSKRQGVINDFHADKSDVILISTKAGGVGLNIQGANRVIILDFGFNPSHEEQAIGRAYRLGQTKPVFVYRLINGGTFEDNIYDKQLFKTSLTQRVVDKKNPRRAASGNARDWLYEPTELPQEDLRQWMGKDQHVLDRILEEQLDAANKDQITGPAIRKLTTIETLTEDADDLPLNEEEQKEVQEELEMRRSLKGKGKKGGAMSASQYAMPPPATARRRPPKNGGAMRPSSTAVPTASSSSNIVKLKTSPITHGHPGGPQPPSTMPNGLPTVTNSYPMPSSGPSRPSSSTQRKAPTPHGLPTPQPPS